MSEYIDRETALSEVSSACSADDAYDKIREVPVADVIRVVRCKDCIESGSNMKRSTFCYLFDKEMDMDFYCANGKEKNA